MTQISTIAVVCAAGVLLFLAKIAVADAPNKQTAEENDDSSRLTTVQLEPIEESISAHMEHIFKPSYRRLKALMQEEPGDVAGWKGIRAEALLLAENGGHLAARRPSDGGIRDGVEYWRTNSGKVRNHGADLYRAAKEKDFDTATRSFRAMTNSCKGRPSEHHCGTSCHGSRSHYFLCWEHDFVRCPRYSL